MLWRTANTEIDCDVLFQYCDLREVYKPLEYLNVALQYDDIPYRKWSSPLDLKEIGMDDPACTRGAPCSSAGSSRGITPRATAPTCPSMS